MPSPRMCCAKCWIAGAPRRLSLVARTERERARRIRAAPSGHLDGAPDVRPTSPTRTGRMCPSACRDGAPGRRVSSLLRPAVAVHLPLPFKRRLTCRRAVDVPAAGAWANAAHETVLRPRRTASMTFRAHTHPIAWLFGALAFAAAAWPSLAGAQAGAPIEAVAHTPALRLIYLANEGVMLEGDWPGADRRPVWRRVADIPCAADRA